MHDNSWHYNNELQKSRGFPSVSYPTTWFIWIVCLFLPSDHLILHFCPSSCKEEKLQLHPDRRPNSSLSSWHYLPTVSFGREVDPYCNKNTANPSWSVRTWRAVGPPHTHTTLQQSAMSTVGPLTWAMGGKKNLEPPLPSDPQQRSRPLLDLPRPLYKSSPGYSQCLPPHLRLLPNPKP